MNRLLGQPAARELPLQAAPAAAWNPLPTLAEATADLEHRRPDLLALRAGYESQEARVRAAVQAQFPRIEIGLTGARDTDGVRTAGFGVVLGLPVFDRQQGEIARQRATRRQLGEEYAARLFDSALPGGGAAGGDGRGAAADRRRRSHPAVPAPAGAALPAGGRQRFPGHPPLLRRQKGSDRQRAGAEPSAGDPGRAGGGAGDGGRTLLPGGSRQRAARGGAMRRWLLPAVLVAIAALVLYLLFRPAREPEKPSSGLLPGLVETGSPQQREFALHLPWQGEVRSGRTVQVLTLEAGRIEAMEAQDGATVRKGDRLFTLGGPAVQGRLSVLQAKIKALRRQQAVVGKTVARERRAVAERLSARDSLEAAEERLAQLGGSLQEAQQALQTLTDHTSIRAPIGGVLTGLQVSAGQAVSADTGLARVVDPAVLQVFATLFPPPGVSLVGLPAAFDGAPGLAATVAAVLPETGPEGGTRIRLEGPGLGGRLHPGQPVSGTLAAPPHRALAVPAAALVYNREEEAFVLVHKEDGGFDPRPVRTGLTAGGWVEILSGLAAGEQVATRGAYELFHRDFNRVFKVAD